jgi:nucleotide-binding universal stress UspA family protein
MSEAGIGRILVGLDGSEPSCAALDWAIRLARCAGAEVIAVYVARATSPRRAGSPPAQYDADQIMRAAFEKQWCKPLADAGVRYRTLVGERRPACLLADIAERVSADLIVVGRRGRGGVAEFLLGSVSHELVLHAARPVLLVSPARRPGARAGATVAPQVGAWSHQGRERTP